MKKLDLGCGNSKKNGYIGVDSLDLPGVDIIHNLNQFPYPFLDNEIDEVYMDNVLEHLDNPIKVIEELHRIMKNDGKLTVAVPYYRSIFAYIDPTHKNFFTSFWFKYFDPNEDLYKKYSYSKAKLKIEKIEFDKEWRKTKNIFHRFMIFLAEKNNSFYEYRLSKFFSLNSLTFTLKVIK